MKRAARLLALFAFALVASPALAHKPSDAHLTLSVEGARVSGRWDLALRDLELALGLDADADGAIRWGELRARLPELDAFALAQLGIAAGGEACATRIVAHAVDRHSDGAYAVLRLEAECAAPIATLALDYGLFAGLDPQHRGLVRIEHASGRHTAVLGGPERRRHFALAASSRVATLLGFGREGVRHIAIGADHVLFLLSLLLPVVLRREGSGWVPAPAWRPVALEVVRLVSAFTLAHSLTLSLAALGQLALPARWVESAIAASVVLAAGSNLLPAAAGRRWIATFAFGLVHGLGFASVLGDLGLAGAPLLPALLGFNLGVELGQLAGVAVFVPAAWALRRTLFYRRFALGLGSAAIAALGLAWLLERSLALRIL